MINANTEKGSNPVKILDNLSNLVQLGDDNSAGQMQNFNMMVTKARKYGCSMVIVHHTGKNLNKGPDGVPTWRGSYDMATRLDKTICMLPCDSYLDGYVTFQILEGKSRKGERLNISIQLNTFDKRWEIFDESSTEDRNYLIKELIEARYVSVYEDVKDIIDRGASSATRYVKQAIQSKFLTEEDWKQWKSEAKDGKWNRDERIRLGKEYMKKNYKVLVNEPGKGGRFIVKKIRNYTKTIFSEDDAISKT